MFFNETAFCSIIGRMKDISIFFDGAKIIDFMITQTDSRCR